MSAMVRELAAWNGFCLSCHDSRPLSLLETGARGLRAWWAGTGVEDRTLDLTCRICGHLEPVYATEQEDAAYDATLVRWPDSAMDFSIIPAAFAEKARLWTDPAAEVLPEAVVPGAVVPEAVVPETRRQATARQEPVAPEAVVPEVVVPPALQPAAALDVGRPGTQQVELRAPITPTIRRTVLARPRVLPTDPLPVELLGAGPLPVAA